MGSYPALVLQPSIKNEHEGKSLHVYFRCRQALSPEQWLTLNRKLAIVQNADPAISNVARSMRLPGMMRRKVMDGSLSKPVPITLEQETDYQYSLQDLEFALDSTGLFPYNLCDLRWRKWVRLVRQTKTDESVDPHSALQESPPAPSRLTLHRQQDGQPRIVDPRLATLIKRRASGAAIPLFLCLTRHDQALLQWGEGEGNRNNAGYKLARNLLGTAELLEAESIDYYPSAHALFQRFCDRCSPALDLDEAEAIWQSASKTPATASRPLDSILISIRWWQLRQHHQRKPKHSLRNRKHLRLRKGSST